MVDNLTPAQRSFCMSRVKGKDTEIELRVRSELHRRGLRFRKHVKHLPGKPDIVFVKLRIAIFVDGDFWHGYKFGSWQHKVSDFWKIKILKNRARDHRCNRQLRKMGWKVVRVWQHDLKGNFEESVERITSIVRVSNLR